MCIKLTLLKRRRKFIGLASNRRLQQVAALFELNARLIVELIVGESHLHFWIVFLIQPRLEELLSAYCFHFVGLFEPIE
jgi:hypothetical protein